MSEVTLPPHDIEAEQGVLAGIILDNGLIGEVLAVIPKAEIFYTDGHQKIFSAIIGLYDSGQSVDMVILANRLMELGQINDIGSYAYLQELTSRRLSPSTAVAHASIVKKLFIKRSTIHLLREGLRDAESPVGPVAELLERVESGIFSIAAESSNAQVFGADKMIAEMFDFLDEQEIRRREGKPPPGVPTGFPDLDEKICGLHDGELAIIGARPGLGKTALAVAIAGHAAVDLGWPVLFFSLE
jgi:replicative DNA helicase